MQHPRPQSMAEALKLTEWSVCCHPDDADEMPRHRASIDKSVADMRRLTGNPPPDAAMPVVTSTEIPQGKIIICGPEDSEAADAAWDTISPTLGNQ